MVDVTDVSDEMFEDPGVGRVRSAARPALIVATYAALLASIPIWYDPETESVVELGLVEVALLDWLTLCSLAIVALVVVPSALRNPAAVRSFAGRFARDRLALLGLVGLAALTLAALYGEFVVGRAVVFDPAVMDNPPYGFSAEFWIPNDCAGTLTDERCYGTLEYPLGTDSSGRDIAHAVMQGTLTSLQVGLTTAVVAGGLGTAVGLAAGSFGGWVDAVSMRLVDVVSSVPAFFAYALTMLALGTGRAHVLLVALFGLFSWGGLARLIRAEVKQVRTEAYVRSARAAGASPWFIVRRHVIPNVGVGVFVPLVTLIPVYMLAEAALSYLGLLHTQMYTVSLGEEIATGFDQPYGKWWYVWWHPVIPALALTSLILCLFLVGDRIGELLDPRAE
ncbi:ABC transporter permease [Halovivax limisalsi]|uniref:ABC transporter permease n=1 Tax=Halovivax limisalsi TaxID=1453760 RepID=UPI001FFD0BBC|nr:ABC transporter permease [Halovivax limisalsi]